MMVCQNTHHTSLWMGSVLVYIRCHDYLSFGRRSVLIYVCCHHYLFCGVSQILYKSDISVVCHVALCSFISVPEPDKQSDFYMSDKMPELHLILLAERHMHLTVNVTVPFRNLFHHFVL